MTASRWLRFFAGALALLILVAAASRLGRATSGASFAPDSLSPPPPPSASLLHRLAESADAYRNGDTVYLVASDRLPYDVVGGFASFEQAREASQGKDDSYHTYPVLTEPDVRGRAMAVLPGCYKNDITTQWVCPKFPVTQALRMSDVEFIDVVYRLRAGAPVTVRLRADSVSAMIFTVDAFDRFIVPYYTKLFGPARVKLMRDSVLAFAATAGPSGH